MTNMLRLSSNNNTRVGSEDILRGINVDKVYDMMLDIWNGRDEFFILFDPMGRKILEEAGEVFEKIARLEISRGAVSNRIVVHSAKKLCSNHTTPQEIRAALQSRLQRS